MGMTKSGGILPNFSKLIRTTQKSNLHGKSHGPGALDLQTLKSTPHQTSLFRVEAAEYLSKPTLRS